MLNLLKKYESLLPSRGLRSTFKNPKQFFDVPLIDIGSVNGKECKGIFSPRTKNGAKSQGIDTNFVEQAEDYYQKHQGYDYWSWCIKNAIGRAGIKSADCIVEFGAGFGSATLPLLTIFPDAYVIATDSNLNLLSILRQLLEKREQAQRCAIVQIDTPKRYLKGNIADIVIGAGVLHHLCEPKEFIRQALKILRPGGCAIFFEPFEAGHLLVNLICTQIAEEAKRRKESSPALDYLSTVPDTLAPLILRDHLPKWKDQNNKWLFPKGMLEKIKREINAADLIIYPLHDSNHQFRQHIAGMLKNHAGIDPETLPRWALNIISKFEEEYCSKEIMEDLLLEGCIIFKKGTGITKESLPQAAIQLLSKPLASCRKPPPAESPLLSLHAVSFLSPAIKKGLEDITSRITAGEDLNTSELLPLLCLEQKDQRGWVNFRLAKAFFEAGQIEKAKSFIQRAWLVSDFSTAFMPLYTSIFSALNDTRAVCEAYKRVGMRASAEGNIQQAIENFNYCHYALAHESKLDRYEYDFDILSYVDSLAAPYRFYTTHKLAPMGNRKIRLGYLVKGIAEQNSELVKINHTIAKFHDKSRFEVVIFTPETNQTILSSPQGSAWIQKFQEAGCEVVTGPGIDTDDLATAILTLGKQLYDAQLDILVMNAALIDFRYYFITSLRPAPVMIGLVQGVLELFAPPMLDWCIAWSKHPLMDAPVNCSLVNLEVDWPELSEIKFYQKSALDIPDDACVLMSSGRPQKFQGRKHWQAIADLLANYPNTYYVVAGVNYDQIPFLDSLLSEQIRPRVKLLGWRQDFLQLLGCADIVIDTYPNGGGQSLVQAMSLGLPIIGHQNDYMKLYDSTDWSPIEDFLIDPDIIIPRGNFSLLKQVIARMIEDVDYRLEIGQRCRLRANINDPSKGVRQCEEIYAKVITLYSQENAQKDLHPSTVLNAPTTIST